MLKFNIIFKKYIKIYKNIQNYIEIIKINRKINKIMKSYKDAQKTSYLLKVHRYNSSHFPRHFHPPNRQKSPPQNPNDLEFTYPTL